MEEKTTINIISDGANWVLDSIKEDYCRNTRHNISSDGDINWVLSWWSLAHNIGRKNTVAHLHHVDQSQIRAYNFNLINNCRACIVPNEITKKLISDIVTVPVIKLPYWLLSSFTQPVESTSRINQIRGDGQKLIIGSFQKDTETVTKKPKLVKGPDRFINIVDKLNKITPVKVVLSGYDRQYVIENLNRLNIEYAYFERDPNISDLYESLDWYFVTSRYEGGPQAAIESCYKKTKVLSTNVGICPEILHKECICHNEDDFVKKVLDNLDHKEYNYNNILQYLPKTVISKYDNFFMEILK